MFWNCGNLKLKFQVSRTVEMFDEVLVFRMAALASTARISSQAHSKAKHTSGTVVEKRHRR